jgi:dUTPase
MIYLLKLLPVCLCSAYDVTVPARGKALIQTDLQIKLPVGCYGRIAPRSGLALHHHIDVGGWCKQTVYASYSGLNVIIQRVYFIVSLLTTRAYNIAVA